ncbi:MAG: alpha/beta hydrolase [bacterium]|nr:alpha/beta hydrolase [bacterium]
MSLKENISRRVIKAGLRLSFKLPSLLPLPIAALRIGMEQGAQLFPVRKDVHIEQISLGGIRTERLSTAQKTDAASSTVILHFHGGAFMAGSPKTHRAMGAEFAARANAVVYMLDYRLAPEHAYPAALDDGLAAYQALLAQGYAPQHIVFGGDSGGCAHILNLAMALREKGLPLPAALVLISPYIDITLSTGSVTTFKARDPMVTAHALHRGSEGYRGAIPAGDARVSPLFADLHGLPPMLVQAGGEEILLDDALRLLERGRAAGVSVDCRIYEGMWHNFQMFSHYLETADRAIDEISYFVRQYTAEAAPRIHGVARAARGTK